MRLLRSYAAQLLALGVTMLERVLVPAALIRAWGADETEGWIVATSAAGLFMLTDLGLQPYATTRLHALASQGDWKRLARVVRTVAWTYGLLVAGGVLALLLVEALGVLERISTSAPAMPAGLLAVLAVNTLLLVPRGLVTALYQAFGDFARGTTIGAGLSLLNLAIVLGLAISGEGPVTAALGLTIGAGAGWAILLTDLSRRHELPPLRPARPSPTEARVIVKGASGYLGVVVAINIWTNLPALLIGAAQLGGGAVLTFALMRTIANLGRQLVAQLAVSAGVADAELRYSGNTVAAGAQLLRMTRFVGGLAGMVTGGVLGFTATALQIWTGGQVTGDFMTLLLLVLPILVIAPAALCGMSLYYGGEPTSLAQAQLVQVTVGSAFAVLLIRPFGITGVAFAFLAAETVASVLIVTTSSRRLGAEPMRLALDTLLPGLACLAVSWLAAAVLDTTLRPQGVLTLATIAIVWCMIVSGPVFLIAVAPPDRAAILRLAARLRLRA